MTKGCRGCSNRDDTTWQPCRTPGVRSCLVWLGVLVLWGCSVTAAEPYRLRFDAPTPSWQIVPLSQEITVLSQQRQPAEERGVWVETVRLSCRQPQTEIRLMHALPASRVLDEVEVTLSVWVSHPGWQLAVRVVASAWKHPDHGEPLSFLVRGEPVRQEGRWVRLRCQTSDRLVRQQLSLMRARFPGMGEPGELYVDQVVLVHPSAPPGMLQLQIEDLEMSPVVPATAVQEIASDLPISELPRVTFELDRVLVDGRPILPRILRDHGESASLLAESGCNWIWVEDWNDVERLKELQREGLWAVAVPPRAIDETGRPLPAQDGGIVPFTAAQDVIACWLMGVRLPAESRRELVEWMTQVRAADRRRQRPMAAEVTGDEWGYSREVNLMGMSRHGLGTMQSLSEYRQWLQTRREMCRPGTFAWTWIQCEPQPSWQDAMQAAGVAACLEPEQIRLQVYAALSAGYRGIGYWTSRPLHTAELGARERLLALRLINLELMLWEPWLASSHGVQRVPCRFQAVGRDVPNRHESMQSRAGAWKWSSRERSLPQEEDEEPQDGPSAVVIRSSLGTLVFVTWWEARSQFVPTLMAGHHVSLVIPGIEQTAMAYEISPTGLNSLGGAQRERVAGGMQITLSRVDQVAAVWLTSDMRAVESMRQRISGLQRPYVATLLELAQLKLDRVGLVDQRLQTVGGRRDQGALHIGRAQLSLEQARQAFQARDEQRARWAAEDALQQLRQLQRTHWHDAVKSLSAPVVSPYTLCFQTLPEHWDLLSRLGRTRSLPSQNWLSSGDFEDRDRFLNEGWQPQHVAVTGIRADAALVPKGRRGGYALRLSCVPAAGGMPRLDPALPLITCQSPTLMLPADHLLYISGWIKIDRPLVGYDQAVHLNESLLGRNSTLRFSYQPEWTRFEWIRELRQNTSWQLTISLSAVGEVYLDDIEVWTWKLDSPAPTPSERAAIEPTGGIPKWYERWPRWPQLSNGR
ncbi:MAG: hypothetical protein KatS3mg114_1193 [Planctomycetaceae bacterium]|nr:MAG: hypothetical protein KatS3mg114_1193 [Planctomycetaceae bacterium]